MDDFVMFVACLNQLACTTYVACKMGAAVGSFIAKWQYNRAEMKAIEAYMGLEP